MIGQNTLPHNLINWSDTPHVCLACAPPCVLAHVPSDVHLACASPMHACMCTPDAHLVCAPLTCTCMCTPTHTCACIPHACLAHASPMRALPVYDWLKLPTTANQITSF